MSEAEIRRLSRERAERIGRREFDAMVDGFYDEDAQLLASGVATVRGREAIREFWRGAPGRGLVSLTLEARDVEVSGEIAFEIGAFVRTLRPRHGAPFQEIGKYLVIYRDTGGGAWRAVAEMFNADSRR
jgi:ketosteroid isomerase-like protein